MVSWCGCDIRSYRAGTLIVRYALPLAVGSQQSNDNAIDAFMKDLTNIDNAKKQQMSQAEAALQARLQRAMVQQNGSSKDAKNLLEEMLRGQDKMNSAVNQQRQSAEDALKAKLAALGDRKNNHESKVCWSAVDP